MMRKMTIVGIMLILVLVGSGLAQENQKKVPVVAGEKAASKAADKIPAAPVDPTDDWAAMLEKMSGGGGGGGAAIKAAATSDEKTDKTPGGVYTKTEMPEQEEQRAPVSIEWMATKQELSRYLPSLNGIWIQIRVRNNGLKAISTLSARISIPDRLHERVADTVKLDFVRESLIPRHLEPGKVLTFEAQLGDYAMPSGWQHGQRFDGHSVEVIFVLFKDGTIWRK